MALIKIYKYAKDHGIPSKDIVEKLKAAGHNSIKNQMSSIEESIIVEVLNKPTSAPKEVKKAEPELKIRQGASRIPTNIDSKPKPIKSKPVEDKKPLPRRTPGGRIIEEGNSRPPRQPYKGNTGPKKLDIDKTLAEATESKPAIAKKPTQKTKPAPKNDYKYKKKEPVVDTTVELKTKTQLKKERRDQREAELKNTQKIAYWHEELTVGDLAQEIDMPSTDIVMKLMQLGIMASVNQHISFDALEILALEYNLKVEEKQIELEYDLDEMIEETIGENKKSTVKRAPIVTIMGHVDHGKTTLLDTIRNTKVAVKEAGGITQHIGAYQIDYDGFKITFLDTPGHEAFTAMRSRGANVTDITILVVSADDGVMPQTIEAISHAKAAKTPIIVAVNKMDKEGANPDKVMSELTEHGIQPEEWGGDVPFIKISALKNEGINDILDYIKLLSEVNEWKGYSKTRAYGTVIESYLDKGRGPVATILVQGGTLNIKDSIVIGSTWGTIRTMTDELNQNYKEATISMPVEITGLKGLPGAGEKFISFESDAKTAQTIGEKLTIIKDQKDRRNSPAMNLEKINEMIEEGLMKELPVIIKADVHGSQEALAQSLEKIEVNGVRVNIIHKGVGAINESDITLSEAANGIVIGFNVRPDANARKLIEKDKVEVMLESVIYKIIEDIEASMMGMREKKFEEINVGEGNILEVFKITGVGKVAGCMITEGKATRSSKVRVIRDGVVVYTSDITSLKRFKDEVKEVRNGEDCGLTISKFEDFKKGDQVEFFEVHEIEEK